MAGQSLNKVLIIGNLTRDPLLRSTPNGASICTFGVATNSKYRKPDGSVAEIVTYIDIVAWSKLADLCAKKLKKGMKVYVEGELRTRRIIDKNDPSKSRLKVEVRIVDMKVLSSRVNSNNAVDEASNNESLSEAYE